MVTAVEIVEALRERPYSTREEIFEFIFGPKLLKDTKNPQMYMTVRIQRLQDNGIIVKSGTRKRADVFMLSDAPMPPLPGMFAFARDREAAEEAEAASRIATKAPAEHSDETKAEATTFFHEVARMGVGIDYRYSEDAIALIANVFTDPYVAFPDSARIDGWIRNIQLLALASTPGRRAAAFGHSKREQGEACFQDIVGEYDLQPGDYGRALMVVAEALSDAVGPSDTSKPWIADAFARIRSMPPAETAAPVAPPAPSPEPAAAPVAAKAPRKRRSPAPAQPITVVTDPSDAIKELALSEFTEDSPAADIVRKYGPLVPHLRECGRSLEEIARTIVDMGRPVPYDMALALLKRSLANGK